MTTQDFFSLAQQFADLGSSIGKQLVDADEAVNARGIEDPIYSLDLNPNAITHDRTQDLLRGLIGEGVEGAEDLFEVLDAELNQPTVEATS